jgi:hypothetical protein
MPILNEKYIEDKVVQWALKHGFLTPKVRFAERGWPDRLFLSPTGHTIFIEFKDPAITKVEPLQNYRIMELRRRGIPAFYCNNVIEGINILKAALEPSPVSEESDSDAPQPSLGGTIIRPRFGQDKHLPSSSKDPEGTGPNYESPDHSPTSSDDEHVAGGTTEVVRIPGDDTHDPTWVIKGTGFD